MVILSFNLTFFNLLIGGIDEAGRGSVIGPLVIGGVSFNNSKIELLRNLQVVDSKKISPKVRKFFFQRIINICDSIFICKIPPRIIDGYVKINKLNALEARVMSIVCDNIKADKIIVDSCDVNPARFKDQIIKNLFNKQVKIYSFHKADSDNLMVAAASILAKVVRDEEVRKIEKITEKQIGSGYPSDPKTKLFLQQNVLNNQCKRFIRFSWRPTKQLLERNVQQKLILK